MTKDTSSGRDSVTICVYFFGFLTDVQVRLTLLKAKSVTYQSLKIST